MLHTRLKSDLRGWLLLPMALILLLFQGRGPEAVAKWNLQPRTLHYLLEQRDADTLSGQLGLPVYDTITLEFLRPAGNVLVHYRGDKTPSRMNEQGRIVPDDPDQPYLLWEIFLTRILPPGGEVDNGKAWIVDRPTDAEVHVDDNIYGQAKVDYTITQTEPLVTAYQGEMRIAPNGGLDAFADQMRVNRALFRKQACTFKPYVAGTATFSMQEGETLKAEGDIVPFAPLMEAGSPQTHPARTHFKITRIR